MFVLFDLCGERTVGGMHTKDREATERARSRREKGKGAKEKDARKGKRRPEVADAVVKPSMNDEVKRFKAIVRHITSHDLPEDQKSWFKSEPRAALRRLAPLGVEGNQPAIAAYCFVSKSEQAMIKKAILGQKIGANPKAAKAHEQHIQAQASSSEEEAAGTTMLFKRSCIAGGATVKWKRRVRNDDLADKRSTEGSEEAKSYTSRELACTRCGAWQETSWMQLRTAEGFRAVHCKVCRLQERSHSNKCQCGVIWHQCKTHRIDPREHWTKKAPNKSQEEKARSEELRREEDKGKKKRPKIDQPPDIEDGQGEIRRKKGTRRKAHEKSGKSLKPMKRVLRVVSPQPALLARIKARIEKRPPRTDDDCIPCGRCDKPADCQSMCGDCEAVWCNECTVYVTCTTCMFPICATCNRTHKDTCKGPQLDWQAQLHLHQQQRELNHQQRQKSDQQKAKADEGSNEPQQQVQSRKSFREMLISKAAEQAAKAPKQARPQEHGAVKLDPKNSKRKAVSDIRRGKTECTDDKHAKFFKTKVPDVLNAAFEHDPKLPGVKGQTNLIKLRLNNRLRDESGFKIKVPAELNATYEHDPKLPGIEGLTDLIKRRLNKRLRDESGCCDAEARRPVKKQRAIEHITKRPSTRTNLKFELNAILRIARTKND